MFSCQPLFQAIIPDSQSLEHSPQPASDFKMYSSASPSHRRLGYPISLAALADLSTHCSTNFSHTSLVIADSATWIFQVALMPSMAASPLQGAGNSCISDFPRRRCRPPVHAPAPASKSVQRNSPAGPCGLPRPSSKDTPAAPPSVVLPRSRRI